MVGRGGAALTEINETDGGGGGGLVLFFILVYLEFHEVSYCRRFGLLHTLLAKMVERSERKGREGEFLLETFPWWGWAGFGFVVIVDYAAAFLMSSCLVVGDTV